MELMMHSKIFIVIVKIVIPLLSKQITRTFSLFLNFMSFVLSSTFTCKSILKHSSINNKSDQLNGFSYSRRKFSRITCLRATYYSERNLALFVVDESHSKDNNSCCTSEFGSINLFLFSYYNTLLVCWVFLALFFVVIDVFMAYRFHVYQQHVYSVGYV